MRKLFSLKARFHTRSVGRSCVRNRFTNSFICSIESVMLSLMSTATASSRPTSSDPKCSTGTRAPSSNTRNADLGSPLTNRLPSRTTAVTFTRSTCTLSANPRPLVVTFAVDRPPPRKLATTRMVRSRISAPALKPQRNGDRSTVQISRPSTKNCIRSTTVPGGSTAARIVISSLT